MKKQDYGAIIMENVIIRREEEKEYRATEELTREAFWNVYKPGADEHYFVHMIVICMDVGILFPQL